MISSTQIIETMTHLNVEKVYSKHILNVPDILKSVW